jgi:TatD DNase family protein
MPAFADSHVHLADAAFDSDRDSVIDRARTTGAQLLVCIGETPATGERALEIACAYPGFVYTTAGVHPHHAATCDLERDRERLRELLSRGAVAVGECGLDYHYDYATREQQLRVLEMQREVAAESGRPMVLHTREAVEDTAAFVREAGRGGIRGVLHCFTGPDSLLDVALDAGWYVSFSGIVTFRKWESDSLLRAVPEDRFLVESDAPYLAPVPHRGRRNEPAYVSFTVARIAEARGQDAASVGKASVRNCAAFFRLATAHSLA